MLLCLPGVYRCLFGVPGQFDVIVRKMLSNKPFKRVCHAAVFALGNQSKFALFVAGETRIFKNSVLCAVTVVLRQAYCNAERVTCELYARRGLLSTSTKGGSSAADASYARLPGIRRGRRSGGAGSAMGSCDSSMLRTTAARRSI